MRNLKLLFIVACVIFVGACSKKNNSPNPNNGLNGDTVSYSPYYFKFTFGDTVHNFSASDSGLTGEGNNLVVLSRQGHTVNQFEEPPFIELRLTSYFDSLSDSSILGLQGQTLRFNDTEDHRLLITYQKSYNEVTWTSATAVDNSYSIHFNTVQFVKRDTTTPIPVDVYLVTGNCNAFMRQYPAAPAIHLSDGTFRLLLTHYYK